MNTVEVGKGLYLIALDEANFMNREDFIKNVGQALEQDGVVTYKLKYHLFDVSQAVAASKNKNSVYARTLAQVIKAFDKSKPEGVEFPNLTDNNKGYFICTPQGKSAKGTYAAKDYFYDDLDAVLGVFKEGRRDSLLVMQSILGGTPIREALSGSHEGPYYIDHELNYEGAHIMVVRGPGMGEISMWNDMAEKMGLDFGSSGFIDTSYVKVHSDKDIEVLKAALKKLNADYAK